MDKQARIIAIVRRLAERPVNPSPEESLFESGILDSFALADMVSALESEFTIQIPDSDLLPRKFDSVARIEAYLEGRT
jgi:acyl carrier protein